MENHILSKNESGCTQFDCEVIEKRVINQMNNIYINPGYQIVEKISNELLNSVYLNEEQTHFKIIPTTNWAKSGKVDKFGKYSEALYS